MTRKERYEYFSKLGLLQSGDQHEANNKQQHLLNRQYELLRKPQYIIAGNGIYAHCWRCHRLVKVNKFIFGALHICK